MRLRLAGAATAMYGASRASIVFARGVVADSSSPLTDTATQGGIVAVCIGLVYFFLQRGDRLAKTQKDIKVAELEAQIAEMKGHEKGYEERIKVLDMEARAIRLDWINARDKLVEVQAELIALQKEMSALKEQNVSLVARLTGEIPNPDRRNHKERP